MKLTADQLREKGYLELADGSWSRIHLNGVDKIPRECVVTLPKRLRQSSKPLMNDLESAFKAEYLDPWGYKHAIPQAIRFKLGNGIWYKPDWVDLTVLPVYAWEVKGPFAHRGGFENLKVAAGLYPAVKWVLVWKDEAGHWQTQTILP